MSKKTATSTNKVDNKYEIDELEEEFLKNCNVEDIPIPKEELKPFQFEVKEVMKSGCNLQIAEYSLLQYDIQSRLSESKNKYNEYKNKYKDQMKDEINRYFNDLKEGKIQQEDFDEKEIKYYEDEAEEIFDENEDQIRELQKDNIQIKLHFMKSFKEKVDKSDNSSNKDDFIKAKNIYMEKRDAILEAALRLVKKIVNDEKEYDKFYKEYYKKA